MCNIWHAWYIKKTYPLIRFWQHTLYHLLWKLVNSFFFGTKQNDKYSKNIFWKLLWVFTSFTKILLSLTKNGTYILNINWKWELLVWYWYFTVVNIKYFCSVNMKNNKNNYTNLRSSKYNYWYAKLSYYQN